VESSQPAEPAMPWPLRLRYAGILVHPTTAVTSKHVRALALYFLGLLLPQALLFAGAAFLACHVPDGVLPFVAAWACLTAVAWWAIYIGGAGPFDCGMIDLDADARVQSSSSHARIHKYLPGRFSSAIALALGLIALESIILAQFFSRDVSTVCSLNATISVNEAPSYSAILAEREESSVPLSLTGGGVPSDYGGGSAVSTQSYFSFQDGFIDTSLAIGVNVTDLDTGAVLLNDADTRSSLGEPTRMLLVAPVFAGVQDPFYRRRVPVWAVGSFSWGASLEEKQSRTKLVQDWATDYHFGETLGSLDPDYPIALSLLTRIIASPAATSMKMLQMTGAPLIAWKDSAPLRNDAENGIIMTLAIAAGLFCLIWIPIGVLHVKWYLRMIREEEEYDKLLSKRGAAREVRVRSANPPHPAAEDGEEAKAEHKHIDVNDGEEHASVEMASLASPSNAAPSVHPSDIAAGSHMNISRSASLSSGTMLLSRPTSASTVSNGGGLNRSRWTNAKSSSWWPFSGGSTSAQANSISPDPVNPRGSQSRPQTAASPTGDIPEHPITPRLTLAGSPSPAFGDMKLEPAGSPQRGSAPALPAYPFQPASAERPTSSGGRRGATASTPRSKRSGSAAVGDSLPPPGDATFGYDASSDEAELEQENSTPRVEEIGGEDPQRSMGLKNRSPKGKQLNPADASVVVERPEPLPPLKIKRAKPTT
jgi:hypothetical protein